MMKKGKTVLQSKRYGIFLCLADTTLLKAAQQMVNEDVSSLAVVDADGYLIGIVTRVDLLRSYCGSDDWESIPVSQCMVRDVVTAAPTDLLSDVARILLEHQIHRVVIVHEEHGKKKPVAVVSAADLVYHMVKAS